MISAPFSAEVRSEHSFLQVDRPFCASGCVVGASGHAANAAQYGCRIDQPDRVARASRLPGVARLGRALHVEPESADCGTVSGNAAAGVGIQARRRSWKLLPAFSADLIETEAGRVFAGSHGEWLDSK